MAYTTIDDPSAYFQTALYTGNGSTQSITNDGNSNLQPDLIWAKNRNDAYDNVLGDSTRGAGLTLISNSTSAEVNEGTNALTSFDSDGFSLGGNSGGWNFSAKTYVARQWKANGGTTSSNTSGTITSTVQANTDAGFSIVTYTGNGSSSQTIGHGLGVTPDIVISKSRDSSYTYPQWYVYHKDLSTNYFLMLNQTNAELNGNGNYYVDSSFSSSVFGVGNDIYGPNVNGDDYIAYCFAEKQGYSKFGRYEGNGYNTGSYIYLGFKPAFFMVKSKSNTSNWLILDSKRDPNNFGTPGGTGTHRLFPNLSNAEDVSEAYDFFANGFQPRNSGSLANIGAQEYVYMAFAENPFVTSTGIPTTAR